MEIYFDSRDVRNLLQSIEDAIKEGDNETLKDDIIEMFSDDQIEEIERRLDTSDFQDFIEEILDEWSGEEPNELLDLLAMRLGEIGIELNYEIEEEEEEETDFDEEEEIGLLDEDEDNFYGEDDENL